MCNDYEQQIAWTEYCRALETIRARIPEDQSEADLPRADDVKISDIAPIMVGDGGDVRLRPMRFGFPPARPKGPPVFNFRSEGRHFGESRRCLVPASAFFEFTGRKYPKAKHRFTLNDAPFMAIAGLWRPSEGNQPPTFAMLTTAPGPDVVPYHDRQVAVLRPDDWLAWLDLSRPEGELLRPLRAGSLAAETVRAGSD